MNTLYRTKNGFIVCNICGDEIVPNDGIHPLYPHIGKHMNALVKNEDTNGFSRLNFSNQSHIGFMHIVNRFPQLCLILVTDIAMFVKRLENLFFISENVIYVVNGLFDHIGYPNKDLKFDVVDVITSTNYHCGLCGGVYDCGLPSIEIAAKHAIKCYENLNRSYVK